MGRASIQGDVGFADALISMGANLTMGDDWIEVRGVGHDHGKLEPIDMDCNLIPDAAMTIAVAALFADGTTTLRNIASWRVKETDRIAAMATELRKVGATVVGRRRLPGRHAAREIDAERRDRHLRRSPDGDVLLAGESWRRAGADQRSKMRRQDVP